MQYDQDVFKNQFLIVKRFFYHVIYYRSISNGYQEHQLQNEFWTLTIDAHLGQATMNLCMVFGSDGCNPTHWKRLSKEQSKELTQSFRDGLFQELDLDKSAWDKYWNSFKDFRDNFVTHRELNFSRPVPYFDTAFDVACYYDKWVRKIISPKKIISPHKCEEPSLEQFAMSLKQSVTQLVNKLLISHRRVHVTRKFVGILV